MNATARRMSSNHTPSIIRAVLFALFAAAVAALPATANAQTTCPADRLTFFPADAVQFQTALDCAVPGARITLRAGSTYSGNFVLRYKPTVYELDGRTPKRIWIRSSAALPARRLGPSDQAMMPALRVPPGSTLPVLRTDLAVLSTTSRLAASHYRFVGIKFFSDHWVNHLVRLGTATERRVSELPNDIGFDRSYFAGSRGEGTKQGFVANGRNIAVTNSSFKDFKDPFNDAQAIIIWNGQGPYLIQNNYLEGSGENIMSGGGDPTIPNLVPSDITIRGNHFFKPLTWTSETSTRPGALGKKWRIKNLFELKNAQRVLLDGNVLENNWIQADQSGFAINFVPRNQSGGCPWCKVQHVTVVNNLIRNSIAGIKLSATDWTFPSGQLQNVVFRNNLFVNINAEAVPGTSPGDRAGRLLQIDNAYPLESPSATPTGPIYVTVDHNTAFASREASFFMWGAVAGFVFTNNVARHNRCPTSNACGMSGDGTSVGTETFARWLLAPANVAGNILFDAGGYGPAQYAPFRNNAFPDAVIFKSSWDGSNVIDLRTGRPAASSTARPNYTVVTLSGTNVLAPDGRKIGADWDLVRPKLDAALAGTALP